MRFAEAADPKLSFRVFLPRERDHEYQAEHLDGRWIIRTNWRAKNFRLMEAKVGEETDRSKWRELLGNRDDAFVNDFDAFRGFLAVEERSGGLRRIRIHRWSAAADSSIESDDPTFTFALADNHEVDTDLVRYTYRVADDARIDLRLQRSNGQADAVEARSGARQLQPCQLLERVPLGHGP